MTQLKAIGHKLQLKLLNFKILKFKLQDSALSHKWQTIDNSLLVSNFEINIL